MADDAEAASNVGGTSADDGTPGPPLTSRKTPKKKRRRLRGSSNGSNGGYTSAPIAPIENEQIAVTSHNGHVTDALAEATGVSDSLTAPVTPRDAKVGVNFEDKGVTDTRTMPEPSAVNKKRIDSLTEGKGVTHVQTVLDALGEKNEVEDSLAANEGVKDTLMLLDALAEKKRFKDSVVVENTKVKNALVVESRKVGDALVVEKKKRVGDSLTETEAPVKDNEEVTNTLMAPEAPKEDDKEVAEALTVLEASDCRMRLDALAEDKRITHALMLPDVPVQAKEVEDTSVKHEQVSVTGNEWKGLQDRCHNCYQREHIKGPPAPHLLPGTCGGGDQAVMGLSTDLPAPAPLPPANRPVELAASLTPCAKFVQPLELPKPQIRICEIPNVARTKERLAIGPNLPSTQWIVQQASKETPDLRAVHIAPLIAAQKVEGENPYLKTPPDVHETSDNGVRVWWYPRDFTQTHINGRWELSGRKGSNACTIICVLMASKINSEKPKLVIDNNKNGLNPKLVSAFANCIAEGNAIHSRLLLGGALSHLNLTVPEAMEATQPSTELLVEWFYMSKTITGPTMLARSLLDQITAALRRWMSPYRLCPRPANNDLYMVLIVDARSVLIAFHRDQGKFTLIDSHSHLHSGAVMAQVEFNRVQDLCLWYEDMCLTIFGSKPDGYELSFLYIRAPSGRPAAMRSPVRLLPKRLREFSGDVRWPPMSYERVTPKEAVLLRDPQSVMQWNYAAVAMTSQRPCDECGTLEGATDATPSPNPAQLMWDPQAPTIQLQRPRSVVARTRAASSRHSSASRRSSPRPRHRRRSGERRLCQPRNFLSDSIYFVLDSFYFVCSPTAHAMPPITEEHCPAEDPNGGPQDSSETDQNPCEPTRPPPD